MKELVFEMVGNWGVVMLYVKRLMIMRQRDQWRFERVVKVLQLAVLGEGWVAQVCSTVTKEERLARI